MEEVMIEGHCARVIPWAKKYAVTAQGAVYSLHWNPPRPLSRWYHGAGYPMAKLCINGTEKVVLVHRLVAELFLPPPLPRQGEVLHQDGDPKNNSVANLRWGTRQENMRDRDRMGRCPTKISLRSKKGGVGCQLTDAEQFRVIQSLAKGRKLSEVAGEFRVSYGVIYRVVGGLVRQVAAASVPEFNSGGGI